MNRTWSVAIAGAVLAVAALAGCGAAELSGSSTCEEYMNADQQDQMKVASKLATQYRTPDFVTPLGFPQIAYDCSNNPKATLDKLFQRYAKG